VSGNRSSGDSKLWVLPSESGVLSRNNRNDLHIDCTTVLRLNVH
jgi:hypothetical protein